MKIEEPKKIAICLLADSKERCEEQISKLEGIKYEVEWWKRYERYQGFYNSFSQIINTATNETESEFIVYINPKAEPNVELINELIDALCSGYCFASIVNFGFWSVTKQLYREIGLLDEKFIGSEYEDVDFSTRMKKHDKAMYWKSDYTYHPAPGTEAGATGAYMPALRTAGRTRFEQKWIETSKTNDQSIIALNPNYSEEFQIRPELKAKERLDISKSWMPWEKTITCKRPHSIYYGVKKMSFIDENLVKVNETRNTAELHVSLINKVFKIFIKGQPNILYSAQLTKAVHGKEQAMGKRMDITSNRLVERELIENGPYELRVYQQGEKIYHNFFVTNPFVFNIPISSKFFNVV